MTDIQQGGRDLERGIIGSVLRKPELYPELSEILKPSDIGWVCYREAWFAMDEIHKSGARIDTLTVGDQLERVGKLDLFKCHDTNSTGRAALAELRQDGEPTSAIDYANGIKDYANKFALLIHFQEAANHAANGRSAANIIADTTNFMSKLEVGGVDTFLQSGEAVKAAMQETEEASKGNVNVVPTGFVDLDKLLHKGAREGRLYIVAAPPGEGKSAFLANLARNAAIAGYPVGYFSMEMSNSENVNRLLAQMSNIDSGRIEGGEFRDDEWPAYYHSVETLESLPIMFDDNPSLTVPKLREKARRMALSGARVILVDSLNLFAEVQNPGSSKTFEAVNRVAYAVKTLARELKVPIWLAHHINREGQKQDGKNEREPRLADLEQSGEKPADVVAFIYHLADDMTNMRRIKIAKNRGGKAPAYVELIFKGETTFFGSATKKFTNFNAQVPVGAESEEE